MNSDKILENLHTAILVSDHHAVVQAANVAAETLFNMSRRSMIGNKLERLIADPKVQSRIQDCLANHALYTVRELEIPLQGKPMLVDLTISTFDYSQNGQAGVLIEINTTNRISRFMQEKNQLERLQSFRLMMRGLAHEIKNPLGGIRGAAQLLDREITDSGQQELTDILIKEADRLTHLVDRVMGSREQLHPELLNIHEVLEHVIDLVTVKSAKLISIKRDYDPALPEINADRGQLIQAILNVVVNAIEAQAGQPQTRVGFVTQFDRMVTINRVRYRQVLKIRIWDDGPGVDDDLQAIVFDPLITNRAEGTGLGLSITQEIIQRHKGVVQLEKYLDKTCFTILLPNVAAGTDEATEVKV